MKRAPSRTITNSFALTTKGKAWRRKQRAHTKRAEERALLRAVRERLAMLESDDRPTRVHAMHASQVLGLLFTNMDTNPPKPINSGIHHQAPPVTLDEWCPVDYVNRSADFMAQLTVAGRAEADELVYIRMATISRDIISGLDWARAGHHQKEPVVVFSIADAEGLNMRASFTVPVDLLLQAMVHVNAEPPTPRGTRNPDYVNVWLKHPWLRHANDWRKKGDSKEGKES